MSCAHLARCALSTARCPIATQRVVADKTDRDYGQSGRVSYSLRAAERLAAVPVPEPLPGLLPGSK